MAVKIIQEGRVVKAVYQGMCQHCKCVFEFNKEDIESEFYDQREGYNVVYLRCPNCKSKLGLEEKIVRYE